MPILRIETRPKQSPAEPPRRGRSPEPPEPRSSSAASGVVVGLVVGLLIVAALAAVLVGRSRSRQAAGGAAVPGVSGAPATQVPGGPLPTAVPMLDPINADYPRESIVAMVRGQAYTMTELETAVRIARVLGTLTGDAVPAYGSPEMLEFQVRMLKRQVDLILLKQAAAEKGIVRPDEPIENLVTDFVTRVGGSDARLQQLMTENGVTQAQLGQWFEDSTLANMFVAQELLADRDPTEREAVTNEWLTAQWAEHESEILVNFYDPETVTSPQGAPAPAAEATMFPVEVVQPGGESAPEPTETSLPTTP